MTDLSDVRIFICTTPTSMNCSFDTLMGMAQEVFDQDPLSGHLFLFLNRSRDRIKILFWDRDGFCIFYKRLEAGTFQLPKGANSAVSPCPLKHSKLSAIFFQFGLALAGRVATTVGDMDTAAALPNDLTEWEKTSPRSWSTSRPNWKCTSTCVPSLFVADAKTGCRVLRD